jgi:pilus assembly protein CpaF
MNSLEVVVKRPSAPPHVLAISEDSDVLIGRGAHCTVRIEDPSVSRTHLSLLVRGITLRVTDSSTNGTLVGDDLVCGQAAQVPLDTPLRIGRILVQVRRNRPEAEEPSSVIVEGENTPANQDIDVEVRREAHRLLLQHLDLVNTDPTKMAEGTLRPKVLSALRNIMTQLKTRLPENASIDRIVGELADEALGLGPLEQLLADPAVTEVMVVDPETIYVERAGKCVRTALRFTDDARVRAVVERIVTPLGRRIDESSPLVDARLKDGSRVNAIIRPLAVRGTSITIRKFPKQALEMQRLIELGSVGAGMAQFLVRAVAAKKNIVVAGGTGSGKTTLLNVLSASIGSEERIVTIEDSAELSLRQPHVVSLETRPANMEGLGEYTIRDLVKNALRMRPDRIVVGECRGGEALDMLQAMNTGHEGSMTTTHANSPREAIMRLETLCLMAGIDLPSRAIREQIAGTLHLIVQQKRLSDGTRKIVEVAEVVGLDRHGEVRLAPLYRYQSTGIAGDGKVEGYFEATGYMPSFLDEFIRKGLIKKGESYL